MSFDGTNGDGPRRPLLGPAGGKLSTALLGSVDVKIETFLGETSMTIAELNALKAGSVVTLAANLNDLVELRVNGVRLAVGELVSVGDKFGVRITSIAS